MEGEDFISFLSDSEPEVAAAKKEAEAPENVKRVKLDSDKGKPPRSSPEGHHHQKLNPWLKPVHAYSRMPVERLQQEIKDLVSYLSPTSDEEAARKAAMARLSQIVTRIYPEATLQPFGSFQMGLFLPSSDIDLVIIMPTDADGMDNTSNAEWCLSRLRRIARAVGKAGLAAERTLKVIGKARVPIVKYTDSLTGFAVDVSVNVGSGLEGAKMMSKMLVEHQSLRALTLLLKHYLSLRGLNEVFTGGLGSFSLMCMLVSFLELHPYLQMGYISEKDNLGVLLLDCLELYSKHFNYDRVGIRLKTAYFARRERADWEHLCKQNSLMMSIEDPQSPENDLSRGSFQMGAVRQALEHFFLVLTTRVGQCRQRPCHLLSSLVWIPERIIRHRSYIKQTAQQ